jgi:hypothetical protein
VAVLAEALAETNSEEQHVTKEELRNAGQKLLRLQEPKQEPKQDKQASTTPSPLPNRAVHLAQLYCQTSSSILQTDPPASFLLFPKK